MILYLLDSIKEIDLSLKEFTKTQREALLPLGEDFANDLEKGITEGTTTTLEALFQISEQANEVGLDLKQTQTIVADVFKGAGENAGGFEKVIEGAFTAINMEYDSLIDNTNAYTIQQQKALNVNREFGELQNELAIQLGAVDGSLSTLKVQVQAVFLQLVVDAIKNVKAFGESLAPVGELFNRIAESMGLVNDEGSDVQQTAETLNQVFRVLNTPLTVITDSLSNIVRLLGVAAEGYNRFLDAIGLGNQQITQAGLGEINRDIALIGGTTEEAGIKYQNYVERITDGNEKIQESTEDTADKQKQSADKSQKAVEGSLNALEDQLNKLNQQLSNTPTDQFGLITSIRDQIATTEDQIEKAKIQLGLLREQAAQPLPDIEQKIDTDIAQDVVRNVTQREEFLDDPSLDFKLRQEAEQENADAINLIRDQTARQERERRESLANDAKKQQEARLAEAQRFAEQYAAIESDLAASIGQTFGDLFSGQIEDFREFQRSIILTALDALERIINLSIAEASAKSLVQSDSIATFGATGVARAGIITGLIRGAFAAVRGVIAGFADGGYTGPGLFPDHTGHRVAGVVHDGEYVVPKRLMSQPKAKTLVEDLEAMRLNLKPIATNIRSKIPGFQGGGLVVDRITPQLVNPSTIINSTSQQNNTPSQLSLSDEDINRLALAVAAGTRIGTRDGISTGLDDATRESEKRALLDNELNN